MAEDSEPTAEIPVAPWGTEKRCTKCGEVKPIDQFGLSRAGRAKLLRPRPSCKKCRVADEKARYRADPAPNKARAADWYLRNRDRAIANAAASAQANPERVRSAKKKYEQLNPEVRRATTQRRRARLRGAETEAFRDVEVFDRDKWICALCGHAIDPDLRAPHPQSVSLDHKVPVSRGGGHTLGNVQAAHLRCNQVKSDQI